MLRPPPRLRGALRALNTLTGYGSSIALLAIASLVVIPELVRAAGLGAWGSIAVGQAIGTVAAVIVAYGWQISGPALVATGDRSTSRREILESVLLKSVLFPPVAGIAAGLAYVAPGTSPTLAAAGAVTTTAIGLTARWYFVGVARPYVFLAVETVPRVGGTVVAILAMRAGHGAFVGLSLQLAGMVLAAVLSVAWILWHTRDVAGQAGLRPLRTAFTRQAAGLNAGVTSAVYVAAPLLIVSAVAPTIQPTYALVDKVQRQLGVALGPAVTVLQGWVPRGTAQGRPGRARRAVALSAVGSVLIGAAVAGAGFPLLDWVGGGRVDVSPWVLALMGLFVGLVLYESALSRAILPALDRLDVVARLTTRSTLLGLPLVALGAIMSLEAALVGLLTGLVLRSWSETRAVFTTAESDR